MKNQFDPQRNYCMFCRYEIPEGAIVCNACTKEAETDKEAFIKRAMGIEPLNTRQHGQQEAK